MLALASLFVSHLSTTARPHNSLLRSKYPPLYFGTTCVRSLWGEEESGVSKVSNDFLQPHYFANLLDMDTLPIRR